MGELYNHPVVAEDIQRIIASELEWDIFRSSSVLITGANGFLPTYLVFTLLKLNDLFNLEIKIKALVRNKEHAEKKFGSLLNRGDLQILVQDVTEPVKVDDRFNFIIHAASQASPKYYSTDPVGTLNANTSGTSELLKVAAKDKARFLFFSSSEVYGSMSPEFIPTKETDFGYLNPALVRSCYAESKRMGETLCVSYHHQYNVPVYIVRPFHTYGPGMQLDDGRVYADFVADILASRNIEMKSAGTAMRAFCYITDATEGFFRVLLNGQPSEAYNIGNPSEEISIVDLAEKLTSLYPDKGLKVIRAQSDSNYLKSTVNRNCPDITKMNQLGWNPSITISKGFKRTIESYL